jgi:Mg-chelatase subunit ChlD
MNARPTYKSIEPRHVQGFNRYGYYRYGRTPSTAPGDFNAEQHVSAPAVAAIHRAFILAKTSHNAWRSYKREGRVDPRRAAAGMRGEVDIFQRKMGRSTSKVKVSVLLDASGSMRDDGTARVINPLTPTDRTVRGKVTTTAAVAAAVFGATIAKALGRVPTVDLDVYQHSASFDQLIIKWRWHKGTPLAVFNESIEGIGGGGNADGHALYAIGKKMLKELKRDQKGIIMVVSDGMPSVYAKDGKSEAGQALIDAAAFCRRNGIEVIAVAIAGEDQSVYYGKDNVIPFNGEWGVLGTTLAQHIGKALARR